MGLGRVNNQHEWLCRQLATSRKLRLVFVQPGDEFCKLNGQESYHNSSYIIGDEEIQLGFYDDEELQLISFFHELGHTMVSNNWRKARNYDTVSIERECWRRGVQLARRHKIRFSKRALDWAEQQVKTYAEYK